jgi:hypothetical protein
LGVVEEIKITGKVLGIINSTFISLILKLDCPSSFDDLRPIALCHCLYKIVAKIIAMCLKPILSNFISPEQFDFLKGRPIHEAIGSAQEGLHTIKNQKKPVFVIKIDLGCTTGSLGCTLGYFYYTLDLS